MVIENIKSKLLLLNQFGFSSHLLENIYLGHDDPIEVIYNSNSILHYKYQDFYSPRDVKISHKYNDLKEFSEKFKEKFSSYLDNNFKIIFKYDNTVVTDLIDKDDMPLFLYSVGNIDLLNEKKRIAIIGTRNPNDLSIDKAKKYTKKYIEQGYITISGLAEGVDTLVHEETMINNGKTIAIIATNFDNIYPKKNIGLYHEILNTGLILTPIGPFENTYKSTFLERNRYVASLSTEVLVIETNLKSGTLNTVRNAHELNKKISFISQKSKEVEEILIKYSGIKIEEV